MLQKMRDRIQGWIAWVLIIALVASMLLWGVSYYFNSAGNARAEAAKVNGQVISLQTVNNAFLRWSQQQPNLTLDPQQQLQVKQAILQELIDQTTLMVAAQKNGFQLSDARIEAILANDQNFQENGKFSTQKFTAILNQLQLTASDLFEQIRLQTLVKQLQIATVFTDFLLPNEIERLGQLLNQTRDVRYLLIPRGRFFSSIQLSNQQLQQYYQANLKNYMLPEQVKLQYVVLSLDKLTAALQANKNLSATEAQQKAQQQFADVSEQLANLAFQSPDSLDNVAKALQLPLQTSDWLTAEKAKNTLLNNPLVRQAAFSSNVLAGNNSDLITINDKTVMVLRVAQHLEARAKPLTQVQNEVRLALLQQLASQKALSLGKQLVEQVQSGKPIDKLIKPLGISWQTANQLSRSSKQLTPALLNIAFNIPAAQNGAQPMMASALPEGDFAIVQLLAVHAPKAALTDVQKKSAEHLLGNALSEADLIQLIDYYRSKTNIKTFNNLADNA